MVFLNVLLSWRHCRGVFWSVHAWMLYRGVLFLKLLFIVSVTKEHHWSARAIGSNGICQATLFFFFFCTSPGSVTKLNDCSANTWKCWSRLTFSKVLFIAEQLLRWARWLLQLKAHMEWMISRSYSQEPVRHMQRLPSFRQILHTCCLPCCLDRCLWVHTNLASTKGPFPRGTVPENHGLPPIIACLLCTFHVHRCRCCYVGAVFPAAHLGPPSFSFTLHIFTHCHFDIRSIVFAQIWRKGQGHRLFDNSDIV